MRNGTTVIADHDVYRQEFQAPAMQLAGVRATMRTIAFVLTAALFALTAMAWADTSRPVRSVLLGDLDPISESQGWGDLQVDSDVAGAPLMLAGQKFAHGLGTHANSEIVYDLTGGSYKSFETWAGVDDSMIAFHPNGITFQIFCDGVKKFDSGVKHVGEPPSHIVVDVSQVKCLRLVALAAGSGIDAEHADWAGAVLTGAGPPNGIVEPVKYLLTSPNLQVGLSSQGSIVSARIGKSKLPMALRCGTLLRGCTRAGAVTSRQTPGGGVEFRMREKDDQNQCCDVVERFAPDGSSIRWTTEICGIGAPWSTSVETRIGYPASAGTRFWAPWSSPDRSSDWKNPLVLRPMVSASWKYGSSPADPDYISLPIATIAEPATDSGLSAVFSPADTYLDTALHTTASGTLRFARYNYRISAARPLQFTVNLVAHEADWRGGLRWMRERYPLYFLPPNPSAPAMAGCGAYSGDEDTIDVDKYKRMAFRINWKLSDDFPYMGMFIPPVTSPTEQWQRSCDEPAPPGKPTSTSCRRLNDYAAYMCANGFYVLDYFNVTEFGKNMASQPATADSTGDLWKQPRAFLASALPDATLIPGAATCYNASVVDPGDPVFQKFVLEQADRHIKWIPDSSGICIDRLDWLSHYNTKADDGVSWVNGAPARSLFVSWNSLLAQLGPKMHAAGKVIFVNNVYSRFDLLRQVDGVYSEYGHTGASLNSTAMMCIDKPAMAWTYKVTLSQPDPDSFFQRYLLMGVYPTAPYPWNNHCIQPDPAADAEYLLYGPLLDTMRSKQWVLQPHCIQSVTAGVDVNLFKVPGGYVAPVVFGRTATSARVVIRNVAGLERTTASAVLPGVAGERPTCAVMHNGTLTVDVQLRHGCAMLLIRPTPIGAHVATP
jgi:hypothetical protein